MRRRLPLGTVDHTGADRERGRAVRHDDDCLIGHVAQVLKDMLFGGTVVEAVETLQAVGAAAVGLNCSVGPDQLEAVVASMKAVAEVPVIAKPNAGMPVIDDKGVAHYDMSPERFTQSMLRLVEKGATIVGGCCGTTPEYIRLLHQAIAGEQGNRE